MRNDDTCYESYVSWCAHSGLAPLPRASFEHCSPDVLELTPGHMYYIPSQKAVAEYVGTGVVDGAQKFFEVWENGDLSNIYISADTLCCRQIQVERGDG